MPKVMLHMILAASFCYDLRVRGFMKTRVPVTAESILHCRTLTRLIKLSTRWVLPERLPGWHPWSAFRKGTPGGFSEGWPEGFPRWPSGEVLRKARRRASRGASPTFRRGMQNMQLFGDVAPLISRFPPTHASRCRGMRHPRPFGLKCSASWSRGSCAACNVGYSGSCWAFCCGQPCRSAAKNCRRTGE